MIRVLHPYANNQRKRLVKSPKIYLRDTGILHTLLAIETFDDLLAHPVLGSSWETIAIENIIASFPEWEPYFYRTAKGTEIDLVLVRGNRKLAFEFKASSAPTLSRGFWIGLEDLNITKAWVVAPVEEGYPIADNVSVTPLSAFFRRF
jgi:hypothetical protein